MKLKHSLALAVLGLGSMITGSFWYLSNKMAWIQGIGTSNPFYALIFGFGYFLTIVSIVQIWMSD